MSSENERWEKLNAYVDGELEPAEAAEIAAEVAADRHAAAAIATLARLKAVTAASLPDAASPATLVARRPTIHRWAIAAAVAALVVAGGIWTLFGVNDRDTALAALVERHATWAGESEERASDTVAAGQVLMASRLGFAAEIPDLSDAGLQLARIAVFGRQDGTSGLHVGYLGSRGCRVSLMIEPAAVPQVVPATEASGPEIAVWAVNGVAYTLVASGMHKPRFATIAASAEAATRSRAPLAPTIRQALRDQRGSSPPCIG